jgi:hypothetical protein
VVRLIRRSDCNDGPPRYCLRRLDRAHQAQRLIQPGWHEAAAPFQRVTMPSIGKSAIRAAAGAGAIGHFNAGNFSRR